MTDSNENHLGDLGRDERGHLICQSVLFFKAIRQGSFTLVEFELPIFSSYN